MSEFVFSGSDRRNAKMIGTPCLVTLPTQKYSVPPVPTSEELVMIAHWDTGATASAISKGIVDFLGLQPTGDKERFNGAGGFYESDIYLVDIYLSENIVFRNVPVSEIKHDKRLVATIGLDIILQSDFGITTSGDKYHIHFRHPSMGNLEFESVPAELSTVHVNPPSELE